jgi:hypothetical protein
MTGALAEIRIHHLPNTSLERYRYINLLCILPFHIIISEGYNVTSRNARQYCRITLFAQLPRLMTINLRFRMDLPRRTCLHIVTCRPVARQQPRNKKLHNGRC